MPHRILTLDIRRPNQLPCAIQMYRRLKGKVVVLKVCLQYTTMARRATMTVPATKKACVCKTKQFQLLRLVRLRSRDDSPCNAIVVDNGLQDPLLLPQKNNIFSENLYSRAHSIALLNVLRAATQKYRMYSRTLKLNLTTTINYPGQASLQHPVEQRRSTPHYSKQRSH